jgi:FixJ family two-component response regulator
MQVRGSPSNGQWLEAANGASLERGIGDHSQVSKNSMISIVDDDSSVREALRDLIRAMGFAVEAFECAEDFLRSDLLLRTSCLITDMRMPGISGLELHMRLLAMGTPIPMILITAFADEREKTRALQAGVIGYLTKPFNEAELLVKIHSALENSEIEKE